jgi:hypothetical protein
MMSERDITNPLLKAASKQGARLFRQNVGLGWVGRIVRKTAETVTLANPRPLHAGLCKGSSDIIGWTPVVVTADMVGRRVAVFTALEVKTPGVPTTDEQAAFVRAVREAGGYAAVVKNVEDGVAALGPVLI